MKLFGSMKNKDGVLEIGGVSTIDLVNKYKTPLYVMDEKLIEDNIEIFKDNFKSNKFETEIIYASKAFLNIYMTKLIKEKGLSLDVVSSGELFIACKGDFPMDRIYFHGNNKSDEELKMIVEKKVGRVVLDNFDEAKRLNEIIGDNEYIQNVQIRLNPGIEAETHEYIKTTKNDSKFGESIYDENIIKKLKEINNLKSINLVGLHVHIGSQIFDGSSFIEASNIMLDFIKKLEENGLNIKELNLGGGFGIYYSEGDKPMDFSKYFKDLIKNLEEGIEERNLSIEKFLIEPGRSIVGNSGTTLYTVGGIKETYGGRSYILVDGGMSDNIRPALYKAKYEAGIANDLDRKDMKKFTVAGKLCESGDILIKDKVLPIPKRGDILAITSTGAYCYTMSSNYNMALRPAVVFVKNKKDILTNRRQKFEDLILTDI